MLLKKMSASLKPALTSSRGRRGLVAAEFGQVSAERRQPLIGRACRLRGLVDPVVLDRVGDHAVVEVGIEGRPVGCCAEAVPHAGQRLVGRVGIIADSVQLIELCGQPAALFCQRQQPGAARVGGVRQVLLLRGQCVRVVLRGTGQLCLPVFQAPSSARAASRRC